MEILIEDDFLPDAEQKRQEILEKGSFEGQEYEGAFYKGIDIGVPLDAVPPISTLHGREIKPKIAFWRLSKPGEDTPAPIHADSICARWAGLLYMSPSNDEMGGTAFWRHKETGHTEFPARRRLTRDQSYANMINEDSADESKWDMTLLVRSKFNRFVTYSTHLYHSRYPFYSENYGSDNESARLIWVIFYD